MIQPLIDFRFIYNFYIILKKLYAFLRTTYLLNQDNFSLLVFVWLNFSNHSHVYVPYKCSIFRKKFYKYKNASMCPKTIYM